MNPQFWLKVGQIWGGSGPTSSVANSILLFTVDKIAFPEIGFWDVFRTLYNIYDGAFLWKQLTAFRKKAPS